MIQDVGIAELFELFETDLRRSAKHAFHSGVKASSIAYACISFRKKPWPMEVSLCFRFQKT